MERDWNGIYRSMKKNWDWVLVDAVNGKIVSGDILRPMKTETGDKFLLMTLDDYMWFTATDGIEKKTVVASEWYGKCDFDSILKVANVQVS